MLLGGVSIGLNTTNCSQRNAWASPAAPTTNSVMAATATAALVYAASLSNPDVPRNLKCVFGSGWDGGNVTVNGTFNGQPQSETFTGAASSTVTGHKPFTTVTGVTKTIAGAGTATVSIGVGPALGLVPAPTDAIGVPIVNTAGVPAFDTGAPTLDTTNGTVTFATAPTGSLGFVVLYMGAHVHTFAE